MPYIVSNWDGEGQNRPVKSDGFRAKSAFSEIPTTGRYCVGLFGELADTEYSGKATVHAVNPKQPDNMLLFVRRDGGLTYVRVEMSGLVKGEVARRVIKDFGVRELSDLIGRSFELVHQDGLTTLTPLPDELEDHAAHAEYTWKRV
ncbi:MAG TPA: hypothetical protein VJA47_01620 [archaeon]|nr:hypothetical protein [archaeon]